MKKIGVLLLMITSLVTWMGCGTWMGYSSAENELIGQVKKVTSVTPIFCPDRVDVDISLGIMKNGVGSLSTDGAILTVWNQADIDILKQANTTGAIVKVTYNEWRFTWCQDRWEISKVEIVP